MTLLYPKNPADSRVNRILKPISLTTEGRHRIEYDWNSTFSTWTQVSDTRYIYSGMLAIQERNGSNVPEVSNTRGWDLSGSLEGAGGIGGLLARSRSYSSGTWGNHDFYHADGNGNITMMLDSSQATVATYKYDPYGNSFTASGSLASANLYRFSSKLWCANAGLYYYGYRFYDPSLQRWLNHDPLEEAGGINLYQFVRNNPVNFVDSFGEQTWPPAVPPSMPYFPPTPRPPSRPPSQVRKDCEAQCKADLNRRLDNCKDLMTKCTIGAGAAGGLLGTLMGGPKLGIIGGTLNAAGAFIVTGNACGIHAGTAYAGCMAGCATIP